MSKIPYFDIASCKQELVDVSRNADGTIYCKYEIDLGVEYEGKMIFEIPKMDITFKGINREFGYSLRSASPVCTLLPNDLEVYFTLIMPEMKPKEVTMKEIEEQFGRPIKIISEKK